MSRQVAFLFGKRVRNSALAFVSLVAAAIIVALTSEANAQNDLNIQSRYTPYIVPIFPSLEPFAPGTSPPSGPPNMRLSEPLAAIGPCLMDIEIIKWLIIKGRFKKERFQYLFNHPEEAARVVAQFFSDPQNVEYFKKEYSKDREADTKKQKPGTERLFVGVGPYPVSWCNQGKTTFKIALPVSPTYATNVLQSNTNNSPGDALGFGGTLQVFTPGLRRGDVIGLSVQSQSLRYDQKYANKSSDAVITQAGYQFFVDAYSYKADGTVNNISGEIGNQKTSLNLPPPNKITIDTIAVGVQNQTTYSPTFHQETVDLFTPQVTFSRQNIPLSNLTCALAIADPRKDGFCYYLDVAITLGQTFSDQTLQQNTSVTASVTPG